MAAALRLAAVDGVRIRGVRKPRQPAPPLPSHVATHAEWMTKAAESTRDAAKTLWAARELDSVLVRALAREILINAEAAANMAGHLSDLLADPERLWR